jgi:hypothetical protein
MLDLAEAAPERADERRARLWRLALRGMATAVLAVAVCATLAEAASPGGSFLLLLLAFVGWVAAVAAWSGWLLVTVGKESGRHPVGRGLRWAARWLAVPVAFAVTIALASTDLPLRVGVRLAEPDMLTFVHSGGMEYPGHVGPYPVSNVDTSDGRVRFTVPETGMKSIGGLVYSTSGPCDLCLHIEGPWYVSRGDR